MAQAIGGPARGRFFFLDELPAIHNLALPIVLALKDGDHLAGKGRQVAGQQAIGMQYLVSAGMGNEVRNLEPGDVVYLWAHFQLPAG